MLLGFNSCVNHYTISCCCTIDIFQMIVRNYLINIVYEFTPLLGDLLLLNLDCGNYVYKLNAKQIRFCDESITIL